MSGGIYESPDGDLLHGDGRPVETEAESHEQRLYRLLGKEQCNVLAEDQTAIRWALDELDTLRRKVRDLQDTVIHVADFGGKTAVQLTRDLRMARSIIEGLAKLRRMDSDLNSTIFEKYHHANECYINLRAVVEPLLPYIRRMSPGFPDSGVVENFSLRSHGEPEVTVGMLRALLAAMEPKP